MDLLISFILLLVYIAIRIISWRVADANGKSPLWIRDLLDFTPKKVETPAQPWIPRLIITPQTKNDKRS
jgi:hypothetical protein